MQSTKQRNHRERPKNKKPSKPNLDTAPAYYSNDGRQKRGQNRFNRKQEDGSDVYYPKSNPRENLFVYKQDLLQKGFEVYSNNKITPAVTEMIDRFPECFNSTKRKVILESMDTALEEPSGFSQSKIHMKEELKEDFGHLLDNEEIPDWFMDGTQMNNKISFDFGNTVSRTQQINKEKTKRIDSNPLAVYVPPESTQEINFDELDKILEEKYVKSKAYINSEDDEEEMFELELGKHSADDKENGQAGKNDIGTKDQSYSVNDSSDYFTDLQNNLKKTLFNDKQIASDEDKDSEESFQESLGFEAKREGKLPKTEPISKILTPEITQPSLIQDLQSSIRPMEQVMMMPNVMSVNRAFCHSLNSSIADAPNPLKEAIENDETFKLTPEEKEARQKTFVDKYGYLDPIMCQLCYEILNSKRRNSMNNFSVNGFNQKSVEKYCTNKYKIFSLFLQGDIITKVWLYKDKNNMILGPFMSYDMDIWNGEPNYFSEDLLISLDQSPFLSIKLWVNRSNIVVKIVDEFMRRTEEIKKMNIPYQQNWQNNVEQKKNYDKKISFHKKSENEILINQKPKANEELNKNFAEMFPSIDEANNHPKSKEKLKKNVKGSEPHLLETLRSAIPQTELEGDLKKNDKQAHNVKAVPLPVSVPPPVVQKKEEKVVQLVKKEVEVELKVEQPKKAQAETEKVDSKKQPVHQKNNPKKHQNQNPQPKEQPVYIKKEGGSEKVIEKVPTANTLQDQEKTANIKSMLGLNF